MKNKPKKRSKTFKSAVEATPEVANCFQNGLAGLGKHSTKIRLKDTQKCDGSLDIDTCTTAKYPNENRWDYAFSYKSLVYFIEVHTANTSEVTTLLKKKRWLVDWLHRKAPEIKALPSGNPSIIWIQSNNNKILPNSSQARSLAKEKIKPVRILELI
jgi:hypothetical protein